MQKKAQLFDIHQGEDMVKINYDQNSRVFDLLFTLKEYIPAKYFETNANGASAELNYYMDLLTRNDMLSDSAPGIPMIWSVQYQCVYHGIHFTMVYDEVYGFVSFAANPNDRAAIAEALKNLVEKEKPM